MRSVARSKPTPRCGSGASRSASRLSGRSTTWSRRSDTGDRTAPVNPDLSVEVDDVDAVYAVVRDSGAEIVHPLQDEEWGVRRFFVRDPNGRVINVLGHR